MRLKSIAFKQFANDPKEWVLERLDLQQINLIVGRNSSGKSRTLSIINALSSLIAGRSALPIAVQFDTVFQSDKDEWKYFVKIQSKLVVAERLSRGKDVLLKREKDGIGTIYSEQDNRPTKFQPPQNTLAVFSRQDSLQHSYLKGLMDWANGTFYYPFGKELGHTSFAAKSSSAPPTNFYDSNQTTGVFIAGQREFGDLYVNAIVEDLCKIGYDISAVGLMAPQTIEFSSPIEINFQCLYVQENNLKAPTEQIDMSQGMFRALSILIHLNYGIMSGKSGCVIIDDIGEGLDFNRSNDIIKLIVAKIQETELQLLISSNDRFVMNSVPLRYWSVLEREGSTVHVYNEKNSKERFENFRFTGLSNFDFFATDFVQGEETGHS